MDKMVTSCMEVSLLCKSGRMYGEVLNKIINVLLMKNKVLGKGGRMCASDL